MYLHEKDTIVNNADAVFFLKMKKEKGHFLKMQLRII